MKPIREQVGVEKADAPLPPFAWPGGYPILYVLGDNEVVCADCATTLDKDEPGEVKTFQIHYEGESEFCALCNSEIESAYGVVSQ